MRDRSTSAPAKPPIRRAGFSVDLVLLTPHGKQLAVLLNRSTDPRAREKWSLPYDLCPPRRRSNRGRPPRPWRAHRDADLDRADRGIQRWTPASCRGRSLRRLRRPGSAGCSGTSRRGRRMVSDGGPSGARVSTAVLIDAANERVRDRLDQAPIAFRLLPPTFTFERASVDVRAPARPTLHKASFRRALQGAWLVEPTEEWRSEGRGRPAQLFRYAPRRRRSSRRGVRFELLG